LKVFEVAREAGLDTSFSVSKRRAVSVRSQNLNVNKFKMNVRNSLANTFRILFVT
jgi:hypothetical protein